MMLPSLPSQSKRVSSLEFLALKESVKLVLLGAETGQEAFMHDALCILQSLGLFTDAFVQSMRFLQARKKSSSFELLVARLLPRLLHPRLTVLGLRHEFVRSSAQARKILQNSICNLTFLEKVDFSGFCNDDMMIQLSLHCPHLRHLAANQSKGITDVALTAITGALRIGKMRFTPGCRRLKRLDIYHCPNVSTSQIVSVLLILPKLTYLASEKLPQVFESSALFESGQQFHLTNFEHVVTHLERAREKINFHLRSEDQFLLKVSEIFPRVTTVKLTLSHLFDDTSTLGQLGNFSSIHTLILDQPVGHLDSNFREFLLIKGQQLRKLCLRVHSAALLDLACIFQFCQQLRTFQFYSMVLDSRMDDFSLEEKSRRRNFSLSPLYDLTDVCLGCVTNTRSAEEDNSNNMDVDEEDTFAEFFKMLMVNFPCLRSLALSGESCSWLKDDNVTTLLEKGAFKRLQKLSVTGKSPLTLFSGKKLLLRCPELKQLMVYGWNNGNQAH